MPENSPPAISLSMVDFMPCRSDCAFLRKRPISGKRLATPQDSPPNKRTASMPSRRTGEQNIQQRHTQRRTEGHTADCTHPLRQHSFISQLGKKSRQELLIGMNATIISPCLDSTPKGEKVLAKCVCRALSVFVLILCVCVWGGCIRAFQLIEKAHVADSSPSESNAPLSKPSSPSSSVISAATAAR